MSRLAAKSTFFACEIPAKSGEQPQPRKVTAGRGTITAHLAHRHSQLQPQPLPAQLASTITLALRLTFLSSPFCISGSSVVHSIGRGSVHHISTRLRDALANIPLSTPHATRPTIHDPRICLVLPHRPNLHGISLSEPWLRSSPTACHPFDRSSPFSDRLAASVRSTQPSPQNNTLVFDESHNWLLGVVTNHRAHAVVLPTSPCRPTSPHLGLAHPRRKPNRSATNLHPRPCSHQISMIHKHTRRSPTLPKERQEQATKISLHHSTTQHSTSNTR